MNFPMRFFLKNSFFKDLKEVISLVIFINVSLAKT